MTGANAPEGLGALLELAALSLGKATPNAETFIMTQRVLKAFRSDFTRQADSLCLTGGAALFREKRLGVGLSAQCALLPGQLFGIFKRQIQTQFE